MAKFLSRLLFVLLLVGGPSQAERLDWTLYGDLLEQYTEPREVDGIRLQWINYTALRQEPRWRELLGQLQLVDARALTQPAEQMAFYINAYNILAIDLVLRHWPLDSIKDIGSWLRPVWGREAGKLGGESVTLDQIEHQILRPMGDPRVHMAIVCASRSCPDLAPEPFSANVLEQQLNQQTQRFLTNPGKGVSLGPDGIAVSKIFDWFEEDFDPQGGVRSWLRGYGIDSDGLSLRYLSYDWRVNGS